MANIHLNDCRKKGSRVLSGREEGRQGRKSFKLDKLDESDEIVNVIVPNDLFSINISFFLGMFGISIRTFGEEKFKEKYIFKCDDVMMQNINDGIKKALKVSNVLKGEN